MSAGPRAFLPVFVMTWRNNTERLERLYNNHGSVAAVARELGVDRKSLARRLDELDIREYRNEPHHTLEDLSPEDVPALNGGGEA